MRGLTAIIGAGIAVALGAIGAQPAVAQVDPGARVNCPGIPGATFHGVARTHGFRTAASISAANGRPPPGGSCNIAGPVVTCRGGFTGTSTVFVAYFVFAGRLDNQPVMRGGYRIRNLIIRRQFPGGAIGVVGNANFQDRNWGAGILHTSFTLALPARQTTTLRLDRVFLSAPGFPRDACNRWRQAFFGIPRPPVRIPNRN